MKILITFKHAQLIKKELGLSLPHIKSSHRAEAMARGLGWKSNAALRAALMCGPTECEVDDTRFRSYLEDRQFEGIDHCSLAETVMQVCGDTIRGRGVDVGTEVNTGATTKHSLFSHMRLNNKWGAAALGLFAVVCYLMATMQTAEDYLDQAMETSLDVASRAAVRSVLILDKDLGNEVIAGLMEYPYIVSAEIKDDHGDRLSFERRDIQAETLSHWIQDLLSFGQQQVYRRVLDLPPTLSDTDAELIVVVDRSKALSVLPGPTFAGMVASLFLAGIFVFSIAAARSAFWAWLRTYLASNYRLAQA
ncbi:MAG: hypothetical protein HWE25_08835 [Alphaproteobacteria bacterium]|nr:hypothetical protein [Alphaproteobacteria bacterium]